MEEGSWIEKIQNLNKKDKKIISNKQNSSI